LWAQIDAEPDDPSTWTEPVHWVGGMAQEPFARAANTAVLHDAFDALVGPGRWHPRHSVTARSAPAACRRRPHRRFPVPYRFRP
jgi:hypothetical protein